jgi:macrolide transport system ATP-binding/permease protein
MTPKAARLAAMRQFGNAENSRNAAPKWIGFRLETVWQDLRFALRQLRKNPGFTATATIILALGIGASVAIFGFVDAALIKPLPYRDSSRLAVLYESNPLGPALSSFVSRLSRLEEDEQILQLAGCVSPAWNAC